MKTRVNDVVGLTTDGKLIRATKDIVGLPTGFNEDDNLFDETIYLKDFYEDSIDSEKRITYNLI
ncbi:hypothetical protein HYW74_02565 [Candidatus Pacearchaeota archaeon]|nr:hypothetical protein [Candidatus Pacearchaeota archaeon]